jgi:hypothetical protein
LLTAAKVKTPTLSRQKTAGQGWGTLGIFVGFLSHLFEAL